MQEEIGSVRIKVKSGDNEAEVEAPLSSIREAIELIPSVIASLPRAGGEAALVVVKGGEETTTASRPGEPAAAGIALNTSPSSIPLVTVEKGDSLSDVITNFFSDPWGRSPRKLMEVRDALQSYGLNYPKQSVAVALLRLAKGSRIRRFKGEGGEYVYTASTGAARIQGPVQPGAVPPSEEEKASPPVQVGEEPEEQLDLDAPSPN